MLRSIILDEDERKRLDWKEGETVRWWLQFGKRMPTLFAWVMQHQKYLTGVNFNTMMPNSKINPHFGQDPDSIRIHLCVEEDKDCVFSIEGWERSWQLGKLFGFDDAFVLHGTTHTGTNPRSILMIDIHKRVVKHFSPNWDKAVRLERPKGVRKELFAQFENRRPG